MRRDPYSDGARESPGDKDAHPDEEGNCGERYTLPGIVFYLEKTASAIKSWQAGIGGSYQKTGYPGWAHADIQHLWA
ncbi:hypothetical protein Y1Q_0019724 [Alligator mississippiensis]|uniref:Uncharacterized protein n=1 Tax=Alligator mississippiensis TaxID=8496 RepID=A0A151PFB5_ALLMI|nr:hypothetical protein Y1Q_0019724 [Alligator mississippiensis]